jgi:uncharacterized protein DUF6221
VTDDLATRLLAAIENTERIARECAQEDARHPSETLPLNKHLRYPYPERLARCIHDAHHQPGMVLRRCAADRKIVDEYQAAIEARDGCELRPADPARDEYDTEVRVLARIVRIVAEGYGLTEE